jgi:hypothetical protein
LNSGLLELGHVSTKDQAADCLTKGLNSLDLARGCDKMGLVDIFCPSWGGVLRYCMFYGFLRVSRDLEINRLKVRELFVRRHVRLI